MQWAEALGATQSTKGTIGPKYPKTLEGAKSIASRRHPNDENTAASGNPLAKKLPLHYQPLLTTGASYYVESILNAPSAGIAAS